jgi:RNA polymerase sigma-70 factor, ECF subfamily
MDEKQLIRNADSNFEAFAELYRRNITRVYRYHMAYVADTNVAEELTSQTFMAVLKELPAWRNRDSFAIKVLEIAVEKCHKDHRASRRELPNDAALYYQVSGLPSDRAAMQRMEIESVSRALKQISSARTEAIILYFFGELTTSEISAVLKKSVDTIGTLVSCGLEDLRTRTSLSSGRETITSDSEDEALIDKLSDLATRITPDPLFESDLEQTLAINYHPKTKKTLTIPTPQISATLGWIVLTGLTFFLLYWRETPNASTKPQTTARPSTQAVTKIVATNLPFTPRRPTASPTATDLPLQDYIVQAGDTCTYIARKFSVTIDLLINLNHLNNTCDIWADQKLKIPITP